MNILKGSIFHKSIKTQQTKKGIHQLFIADYLEVIRFKILSSQFTLSFWIQLSISFICNFASLKAEKKLLSEQEPKRFFCGISNR